MSPSRRHDTARDPRGLHRRGREARSRLLDTESQRLAHVGSWEWDALRDVVTWSDELYRIYGLGPRAFAGTYQAFLERVHEEDRAYTREVIARAFRESKPFDYDHRIVRADGAVRMLQTRGDVVLGEGGKVVRLVGCCMDVTEQWETRRRLDDSLALLRSTLDATDDGIFVVDLTGKLVLFNRRAVELWRLPETLVARGDLQALVDFVCPQLADPEAFIARERDLMSSPSKRGIETIRFKDGRVFERATEPQVQGGRIVGRVCSFRDVTERERAVEGLRGLASELEERVRLRTADLHRKTDELARSNEELEAFAAAASHDLLAPLRRISAFSQLLEKDSAGKLSPEELAMLGRIHHSAADMMRLIADVLALAKASRETLPVEDVDLDKTMGEVVADLEVPLKESGGSVDAGPLPAVRGHASLWRRLLQNLVANALKFRAPGRPPRVLIRAQPDARGGVVISVDDNGIGFEPRFCREIFLPFRRLNPVTAYAGSGIGLATCERIVRRYGGEITAQSEAGRGSTFLIRLPPEALSGPPEAAA